MGVEVFFYDLIKNLLYVIDLGFFSLLYGHNWKFYFSLLHYASHFMYVLTLSGFWFCLNFSCSLLIFFLDSPILS